MTDAKKASLALQWAVDEMERRYKMLSDFKVRSIDGFNQKLELLRKQREADSPAVIDVGEEEEVAEDWDQQGQAGLITSHAPPCEPRACLSPARPWVSQPS